MAVVEKYAEKTYEIESNGGTFTLSAEFKSLIGNDSVSLVRISYDKGIYTPGKVDLILQDDNNYLSDDTLKKIFGPTIDTETKDTTTTTTYTTHLFKVTIDTNVIADGYRLFKIKKVNKKTASTRDNKKSNASTIRQIHLMLYSPDYLWTLTPGSQAWTGQRLGDILSIQAGKDNISYAKGVLNFLDYNYKENGTAKTGELPQSYLVQYNEPFHDFVCRTANRCGEFLYWEDGKLYYGLPSTTAVTPTSGYLMNQEFDNPLTMSTSAVKTLNNVSDDYSYNTISELQKEGKDKISPWGWWILKSTFEAATQGDSLDTIVGKMVEESVMDAVDCIAAGISRDNEWKKYTDSSGDKSFSATTGIQNVYKSGATYQTLLNSFYNQVRELERVKTAEKLTMDYQATMHGCKLGNVIKIDSSNYAITRIHGYVDNQAGNKTSHKVEAIECLTFDSTSNDFKYKNDTAYSAITSFVVPPLDSRPCIRSAEPMEAEVFKNNDPDYNGRVRVKFLWQRIEKKNANNQIEVSYVGDATPWIRVSTPYSGKDGDGGFNMIPDTDAHVMLGFMYNNIEMPYVSGSVYYNGNRAPRGYTDAAGFTLKPDYQVQTISSRNGANLTFIDGGNDVNFFNGIIPVIPQMWNLIGGIMESKDPTGKAGTRKWSAGLNSDIRLRDRNGIVDLTMSSAGKKILITSSFGKVEIDAYTGITISAPNGDVKIVGKNVSIEAGNNLSLKSGANIRNKGEGDAWKSTFAGILGKVVAEIPKAAMKESIGLNPAQMFDLSFLRVVTETIIRPVEGTLSISSNRNVAITAGKGAVRVPKSLISDASVGRNNKKKFNDIASDKEQNSDGFKYLYLAKAFKEISDVIQSICERNNSLRNYILSRNKLHATISEFITITKEDRNSIWAYISGEIKQPSSADDIIKAISEYKVIDDKDKNAYKKIKLESEIEIPQPLPNGLNEEAVIAARNLKVKDHNLHKTAESIVQCLNDTLHNKATYMTSERIELGKAEPAIDVNSLDNTFKVFIKTSVGFVFEVDGIKTDLMKKLENYFDSVEHDGICNDIGLTMSSETAKKKVIWKFINQNGKIKELFDLTDDQNNALNETTFWGKLKVAPPKSYGAGNFFKDAFASLGNNLLGLDADFNSGFAGFNKLFNRDGAAGPRAHWDLVSKGGILVSSDPGYTVKLKSDGSGWEDVQNPGIEVLNTWMKGNTNPTELLDILNEVQPQN